MPQIGYAHRPVALGTRGMVAAAHPLATLAGLETLKSGGTAADAAVAVNGVLAVTQPNSCGLGGDLFCLYYEAATGRVRFLNGGGRSGARASLDELARRGLDRLPVIGPPTVSVPGCVRAWAMLLERFGTRRLPDLGARESGDSRVRVGDAGSRVAPGLRPGRPRASARRAVRPARPRPHAPRPRRGRARPLLHGACRPGDRAPARARGFPHGGGPRHAHRRMG